jgi:hypothetical protein
MTMLKSLPAVDMTVLASQAWTKLNETPFFPGGNCLMHFEEPIGGAGVITIEGSPDGVNGVFTIRTLNAAQTAGLIAEITGLPKYIRTRVSTVGTGSLLPTLHGVQ